MILNTPYLYSMEEQEILDREIAPIETAPLWPYLLTGGVAAGAVKVAFAYMAPNSSLSLGVILLVLLSMIMMNTTLNYYYQRKNAARDLRSAVIICGGIYVLMQAVSRLALYLLDRFPNEFFDDWQYDVPVSLAAGVVISLLVAVLSRKP